MKDQFVYHLVDPTDGKVRYVGCSANPKGRLRSHINESRLKQNTEKKIWIAELHVKGYEPILVIVSAALSEQHAREVESQQCHAHFTTIFNLHDPTKGAKALPKPQ